MSINDTQMLFPASLIPQLGDVRDQEWQEFVDKIVEEQREIDTRTNGYKKQTQ